MNGRALLMLGAGFTLWAVVFVALYAMLSVGCRLGWDHVELAGSVTLQRAQLIAIFLVGLVASLALTMVVSGPGQASTLRSAARWSTLAATVALLLVFAPVFALSTCY
ncbi:MULTISPECIES: hypothetical protein [unclassified Chelatococcus]|uniref:hypothetical protein n=1 Tax=unclassified Chelatococcus TaxID=2638111 RepID=UPI001BCC5441|nr:MULTISPECIES: hypothetical protein [unclassified Chelatococcus]CAH1655373.1 conserved membrane hypothetical protein [Hyphomicrobiales bacterium]MBS7742620.1 hypothetical protein [Chelatococcus sp. HY11]MBX3542262.1 hypothetical protein [Chelatococcus sp.]MCO5075520.1 hypothetical protein [Chelatococcus sp.]CAH1695451.1 conserved membrane hypothetical protein [Hyphomicrobiales bacterium]